MSKIVERLLLLLVISLSAFPKLVPILLYLLGFLSIFHFIQNKKITQFSYWTILPLGFFLIYLISVGFSENQKEALGVLESKIAFALLPFVFLVLSFENINSSKLISYFTWANVFVLIILFFRALWFYFLEFSPSQDPSTRLNEHWFNQSYFSVLLHPSYFAMYLTFSLTFICDKIYKSGFTILRTFQLSMLLVGIYCCDGVVGNYVTLFILLLSGLRYLSIKQFIIKHSLIIFIAGALISISSLLYYSSLLNIKVFSFYQSIDTSSTSSIDARILIWKTVIFDVFPESGLLGIGSGDVKEVLTQAYQKNKFTGCYQRQFNAHNQFLQTSISLGLLGFLSLCSIVLLPIVFFFKNKSFLGFCFSVIIFLNLLTESMFERQAGVVFFVLFYLLMHKKDAYEINE